MLRSLRSLRGCGRLGHFVPTSPSTHIFAGLQTYGLLIRPAKTSYTAGTLCDIRAEKISKNYVKSNDKIISIN
jgi:hypothetical protein